MLSLFPLLCYELTALEFLLGEKALKYILHEEYVSLVCNLVRQYFAN
jgi:hypothetical protein